MKKIYLLIISSLFLVMTFGCSKKENDDNIDIYPVSSYEETLEITLGDVMPFYDNGVVNIYHLQNSRGTNSMYYHPISRLTTTDFLHYNDEGISINFEEEYSSPDAALGTGSFIKDEFGTYHCFYTGHNAQDQTGLKYIEVIRHATSKDQITWVKDESFNLYGYCNDFRDPYVYYDKDDDAYQMLVTTRENDSGVIKRYTSKTLSASSEEWVDSGVFFYNDEGSYNMECPSYIEYNGYYYLAYSEQGDNRVTHYRYRTSSDGQWYRFSNDSIDSSGFYAGRIEKVEDELYAFAWCANLTGGFEGDFDWGGNLVVHKLNQSSSGELNAVIVDNVINTISNEVEYKTIFDKKISNIGFNGEKFEAICFKKLKRNITRFNFSFEINDKKGDFGITFNVNGSDNRLGSCLIAFEPNNNKLSCYNSVSNAIRYGNTLATVPFVFSKNKKYNVDIIISDEIMTVYLDESVALTVRLLGISNKNFSFYSNEANIFIKGIKFYE